MHNMMTEIAHDVREALIRKYMATGEGRELLLRSIEHPLTQAIYNPGRRRDSATYAKTLRLILDRCSRRDPIDFKKWESLMIRAQVNAQGAPPGTNGLAAHTFAVLESIPGRTPEEREAERQQGITNFNANLAGLEKLFQDRLDTVRKARELLSLNEPQAAARCIKKGDWTTGFGQLTQHVSELLDEDWDPENEDEDDGA